jgi:predicted O-methyltransferase YrrM
MEDNSAGEHHVTSTLLSHLGLKAQLIWDILDPSALGRYRKLSRPVDGWLTREEEETLFRLAQAVPKEQCIVELGSWFGRSAILLAGGSIQGNGPHVHAVDLFQATGYAKEVLEDRAGKEANDFWGRFHANMRAAGVDHQVTAIRSETAALGESWNGPPVGLLFIDADHSYEGVRHDWTAWRCRIAPQGKLAFHDYQNPAFEGVTRFVDELIRQGSLRAAERHDSIVCGEVAHGRPVP